MDKSFKARFLNFSENWWWGEARRDIIFKLLRPLDRDSRILEIGCSGGFLIKFLRNKGFTDIRGIDIDEDAINLCKKRGITDVYVMDGTKTGFGDGEFDIIIISDVLEHIKDDNLALTEWNRIIKHEGRLIIFAPAFNFLYSEHDKRSHHCRRYSRSTLTDILKKTGFKIDRSSYWNFGLFFPASLTAVFQRIFLWKKVPKDTQLYELNPLINKLILQLLKLENCLLAKWNFPVGVSIFAIAEK